MPLGDGYTAEEQISVTPLRRDVWMRIKDAHKARPAMVLHRSEEFVACARSETSIMCMTPGGRMKQKIYPDAYSLSDWDDSQTQRVFVSMAHGKDWTAITGAKATPFPPSAQDCADSGLPWFDYYGVDVESAPRGLEALPGAKRLGGLKSLSKMFKETTVSDLAWAEDIETPEPVVLSPRYREVKSSDPL